MVKGLMVKGLMVKGLMVKVVVILQGVFQKIGEFLE
jgi:hypothetical protein|tara:strand:- start:9396 stop:9503 length:108 start_codon:yes stop_codon:yes gene_type:complete